MRTNIDRDTPAVIGAAKDLVESTCKLILDDRGIAYAAAAPLLDLYRAVALELRLSRDSVPANAKGSEAAQRALQGLVTTVQNLAELRNAIGVGHGRPQRVPALERHARLAMGASSTVADFLLSTWYARRDAPDG
jgi:Abortive infection C-terminus